jgi:predicted amidohydrolase YtcJ
MLVLQNRPRRVSLVLVHGVVHTMDDRHPHVQAVAIDGGTVVAVGTSEQIQERYRAAQVIDLGGRAVLPGFIDAHGHVEGLGAALMHLDLSGSSSVQEVRTRLARKLQSLPPGRWIRGRGWDQTLWSGARFPHHRDLDDVARDIPVVLVRVDGHAVWVNHVALTAAGISRQTPDPPGGRILREPDGTPTGVLVDNAMQLVQAAMPVPDRQERLEAILRAAHELVRYGLTQVHDMGVDREALDVYRELSAARRLPLRIYAALDADSSTWRPSEHLSPEIDEGDQRLTVRALKLYADGALGSRGAALLEPYSDDPGNRGLTLVSGDALRQKCAEALDRGFQVCTHAIGDRANAIVLDAYERVLRERGIDGSAARFRIEHAQVIHPDDIPRFARLGVLPSMQPTHCTSDMRWAELRLGPVRIHGAYAWRSFLDSGSILPGGSDFPVESPDPLGGIYAAVTRQDARGVPPGGWYPAQRLTREEALKCFTTWAAYAAFQEGKTGILARGAWADVVVLTGDPLTCRPEELESVKALLTIVGGRIEFASGPFSSLVAEMDSRR